MKRITHNARARDKLLHIEAEGCVVNIHVGLTDREGRRVTSVQILPDDETRGGDGEGGLWHLLTDDDLPVSGSYNVRIARDPEKAEREFPARPQDAALCIHGTLVWRGHECGHCEAAGEYVWDADPDTTECRALELEEGHVWREYGMDEWLLVDDEPGGSGDNITVIDQTGHTTWLDGDTVVEIVKRKKD